VTDGVLYTASICTITTIFMINFLPLFHNLSVSSMLVFSGRYVGLSNATLRSRPRVRFFCRSSKTDGSSWNSNEVSLLAGTLNPTETIPSSPVVFTPRPPSSEVIGSMLFVLLLTSLAGAYWWRVVVPSARASVGRSKRGGEIKTYLEELEVDESRRVERWFYTDWRNQKKDRESGKMTANKTTTTTTTTTTKMMTPASTEEEEDESVFRPTFATPTPAFFSLDNPIVFVFVALFVLIVGGSLLD